MVAVVGRFTACALGSVLMLGLPGRAQEQVVPPSELDRMVLEESEARERRQEQVEKFFGGEPAKRVLARTKIDYRKVQEAVAHLDPVELDRLARQVEEVEKNFAAGALTNQQLTYIVIALAAAVLVLVLA